MKSKNFSSQQIDNCLEIIMVIETYAKGLWVYVDSLYSTYLVVQIRLSYDDSIYLVIEIMTYDKEFFMKDKKKEEKVKIHVQR